MGFEGGLRRKIVGHDEAVQAVVDLYQVFRAGLNSPGRPVGNLLFLGISNTSTIRMATLPETPYLPKQPNESRAAFAPTTP
jgi:ATP-dependent Clp protease ATP-binding subunit ClpA